MYKINNEPINGRELVIYGAGSDAKMVGAYLAQFNVPVSFNVVTNAPTEHLDDNKTTIGDAVYSPNVLDAARHFVLIASSRYYREIEDVLKSSRYAAEVDYYVWNVWKNHDERLSYFLENSPLDQLEKDKFCYYSCNELRQSISFGGDKENLDVRFCCDTGDNFNTIRPKVIVENNLSVGENLDKILSVKETLLSDMKSGLDNKPDGYFCKNCANIKNAYGLMIQNLCSLP